MKETHRQKARAQVDDLLARLKQMPPVDGLDALAEEAESLGRLIDAFHMEGIRFRMFNVDRRMKRLPGGLPDDAAGLFEDIRRNLEAAGFHTRSH